MASDFALCLNSRLVSQWHAEGREIDWFLHWGSSSIIGLGKRVSGYTRTLHIEPAHERSQRRLLLR